jgi:STE24 endopeptidase
MDVSTSDWERSRSFDRWRKIVAQGTALVVVALIFLFQASTVDALVEFCEQYPSPIQDGIFICVIYVSIAVLLITLMFPSVLAAKKFGVITCSISALAALYCKRMLVIAAYFLPFAAFARYMSIHTENYAIWLVALMALLANLHSMVFPQVIMPFYFDVSDLGNGELRDRLEALLQRAGLAKERLRVLHVAGLTSVSNAAVAGMGKRREVVLTDTLVRDFSPEEIESIVAHEIGHLKHHHVFWRNALSTTILVAFGLALPFLSGVYEELKELAYFHGLLAACVMIWGLSRAAIGPLCRRQEFQADEYCVRLLGRADIYTAALTKLHSKSLALTRQATTHPTLQKRIQRLHAIGLEMANAASA